MRKIMASIKDVAKHVGCSVSTVSRVINNRDAVDAETRRRVLEAIDLLGFRPNLVAKGLRTRKGKLIGLMLPEVSTQIFSVITQHALDAAGRRGYNIVIVNSHDDPDIEARHIQDLLLRNINGIIFCRVSDESRIVSRIVSEKIPVVVIDRAFEHENVPNIVLDNNKAGYLAGQYLTGCGHRQITCVTGPMKISLCRERLNGFRAALREHGVDLDSSRICEGDFSFSSGIEAVRKLRSQQAQLTAIWAMNDVMAFGVMKELYERGINVPHDVSVMGLDDHVFGNMSTPSLTTIHYPFKDLAERAIDVVTRQIEFPDGRSETTVLEPSLVVRQSTALLRESPARVQEPGGPDGNENHC